MQPGAASIAAPRNRNHWRAGIFAAISECRLTSPTCTLAEFPILSPRVVEVSPEHSLLKSHAGILTFSDSACVIKSPHFGGNSLRSPDLSLVQPIHQARLHLLCSPDRCARHPSSISEAALSKMTLGSELVQLLNRYRQQPDPPLTPDLDTPYPESGTTAL